MLQEFRISIDLKIFHQRVTQKPLQDSSRQHIQKIALSLAERYQNTPTNADKFLLTTFYLLVDLMTFFDEFHAQRIESALVVRHEYYQVLNCKFPSINSKPNVCR